MGGERCQEGEGSEEGEGELYENINGEQHEVWKCSRKDAPINTQPQGVRLYVTSDGRPYALMKKKSGEDCRVYI